LWDIFVPITQANRCAAGGGICSFFWDTFRIAVQKGGAAGLEKINVPVIVQLPQVRAPGLCKTRGKGGLKACLHPSESCLLFRIATDIGNTFYHLSIEILPGRAIK
jgi:hypothetical protein